MDSLVSTEWLGQALGADDLAIVDSTAFLPTMNRDPVAEFEAGHIPGARFLDIAEVADRSNPAPHSLPNSANFGEAMERLGVGRDERIVVYDNSPLRTAVRGWFMFRHFGAARVAVLDGGLGKWRAEGRPVESGPARPRSGRLFVAEEKVGEVVDKAMLLGGIGPPILDARSHARFTGAEADPRPTVAPGHIPGAKSMPMGLFYRADGTFVDDDEIRRLFADAGVDPGRPFVASCGSGVTANTLIFAAHRLGSDCGQLYDGSWSEWGSDPKTPKELGEAP
jgi:thiosulfate/3-mercaptopyruvate sulfurtransferase